MVASSLKLRPANLPLGTIWFTIDKDSEGVTGFYTEADTRLQGSFVAGGGSVVADDEADRIAGGNTQARNIKSAVFFVTARLLFIRSRLTDRN